ncbi:unnamed protein product [Brachionus calyciflorus]|uniref:UPAR/Ly6 domain-containing protein n=1 Tax=Brachionus calyciflorus TaxID=104777 RepID=A0A813YTJ6_9BILA|nr:unnamed protein product [Brachionus calyciflorus]
MKLDKFYSILVLILAFNFIDCASRCYSCSGLDCSQATIETCGSPYATCQKIITSTGGVKIYTKGCSDICVNGDEFRFGTSKLNYLCCKTDLCNSSNRISNAGILNLIYPIILISSFNQILRVLG